MLLPVMSVAMTFEVEASSSSEVWCTGRVPGMIKVCARLAEGTATWECQDSVPWLTRLLLWSLPLTADTVQALRTQSKLLQ